MADRIAAARFYFHGDVPGVEPDALGNHWFNIGNTVPADIVAQVGDHLFEDQPEASAAQQDAAPALPKRRGRPPRVRADN
ncbi:hypothetical protein [Kineosporia succinea]|uniref:DNA (cytosine-5-)-methyltransferase n=1 Tax=Kineosporia succinea TaxID=84632 RepID=A0ABT9NXS0_9ACTN|nr:hypothetical protein [Kineosporia succinea]MDP9825222.1 hypothetical protein [Kineosporia succinea]